MTTSARRPPTPVVGVGELKTHASEIIRDMRERRVRYTVTYRGQAVGVLMPLDQPGAAAAAARVMPGP